jgi:hypothetical protein
VPKRLEDVALPGERTVWVMLAATGHPGATLAKGKRSSPNR